MQQDHFALFDLQPSFDIDASRLDRAYREVQNRVHPDKFVGASSAEQRVAMQWATHANEAYQTLKNPLKRAAYLCALHGIDLQTESNTAMPATFLMQQMSWREQLDDARGNLANLQQLENEVRAAHRAQVAEIAAQLAATDYEQAAKSVRQLMFLEKFTDDLDRATEQLVD